MVIKRQLTSLLLVLVGLLTISVFCVAFAQQELTEEFQQTYPLAATGRVNLDNINGSVRVLVWDRPEVQVQATKRAYTEERLTEVKIDITAEAESIRIKTRYPESRMNWTNDEDGRRHNPASVDYILTVPRAARIDKIDLINGALDLEGLTGYVRASSINGRVKAIGLTGEVKLSTVNGRLEATFDRLIDPQLIRLDSVNGSVVLVLPPDSSAEVQASTVHGGISNSFGLPVERGRHVGRNLNGILGEGRARIRLSNVNGSINIRSATDGPTVNGAAHTEDAKDFEVSLADRGPHDDVEQALRDAEQLMRNHAQAARDIEQALRDQLQAGQDAEQSGRDQAQALRELEQAARDQEQAARDIEQSIRDQEQALREAEQAMREQEQAVREMEQALREQEREQREAEELYREQARERRAEKERPAERQERQAERGPRKPLK